MRLIRISEALKQKRKAMLSGAVSESDEIAAKALDAIIEVLEAEIEYLCK